MKKELVGTNYTPPTVEVVNFTVGGFLASSVSGIDINDWENEDDSINMY